MKKIAVVPRLPQPVLEQIAKLGEVLAAQPGAPLDKAGVRELMRDADAALVTAGSRICMSCADWNRLRRMPNSARNGKPVNWKTNASWQI